MKFNISLPMDNSNSTSPSRFIQQRISFGPSTLRDSVRVETKELVFFVNKRLIQGPPQLMKDMIKAKVARGALRAFVAA